MVEYVDGWAARIARSRYPRECRLCEGVIHKGTLYISRDSGVPGDRWAWHEHVDCVAPWWQVDLRNLLRNLGQMPGAVPPANVKDPRLANIDLIFQTEAPGLGQITFKPDQAVKEKFLHAPDLELQAAAKAEMEMFLGLAADVMVRAFGHQQAAYQMSNVLQQLEQVVETAHADK